MGKLALFSSSGAVVVFTTCLIEGDSRLILATNPLLLLGIAVVVGCFLNLITRTLWKWFWAIDPKDRVVDRAMAGDLKKCSEGIFGHGQANPFCKIEEAFRKSDRRRLSAIDCLTVEVTCGICALVLFIVGAVTSTSLQLISAAGIVVFAGITEWQRRQVRNAHDKLYCTFIETKARLEGWRKMIDGTEGDGSKAPLE
jgi:hypothetical protein